MAIICTRNECQTHLLGLKLCRFLRLKAFKDADISVAQMDLELSALLLQLASSSELLDQQA